MSYSQHRKDRFLTFANHSDRPCHHIPGGKVSEKVINTTDENHPRIEAAFRKYFHRKPYIEESKPDSENADPQDFPKERHEFEIIVCHANVIR